MQNKLLIVGNPNTGKTTLFNALTGAREKTANYGGVTVQAKEGSFNCAGQNLELVDLPGVYSFSDSSKDERVTEQYLSDYKGCPVLFVCSSSDIKRNMILLSEVANKGHKLLVLINRMGAPVDEAGISQLKNILNVPVLQADVKNAKDDLIDWISTSVATNINEKVDFKKLINLFQSSPKRVEKLERALMHGFWGKVIFCLVFALVLVISYGRVGSGLSMFVERGVLKLGAIVSTFLINAKILWLENFWSTVLIGGVGQVIVYLPQLALMLTLLFLLEEIGYFARAASLFNHGLEGFGMNGKSIFSLIMGMGCTTSAMLTTRNIGESKERLNTAKFLPFVGCSAKLPVIIFITQVVMGGRSLVYVGLLYITAIVIGGVYLRLTKGKEEDNFFIAEIPRLKIPSLKNSIKQSLYIVWDLFKKITISVLLCATVLWLLLNLTPTFKFFTGEKSLLEYSAEAMAHLFIPLGINRSDVAIALLSGLIAKENIMGVIGLFGDLATLSAVQAITFLIFVMLYSPCVPALRCASCEFGNRFAIKMCFTQMLIAYLCAFVFSTFAKISIALGFVSLAIVLGLIILMVKLFRPKEKKAKRVLANTA